MFGLSNQFQPSFGGVIFANGGHVADIELDGSGQYRGQRKMWRFRLVKGDIVTTKDLTIQLHNDVRSARITSYPDHKNYGYVELL
ncbi:MAG: hypothetical protein QNJ45_04920 [Ardenticatenaceae bacterium]|nr:hypothetical protein [Ardenticatenaceae bacterium]